MLDLKEQDAKARVQALDTQQSFIIQAPAGSGKTELLIQRYLSLLSQVKRPEEILAITFTKKAALEMRNRVIKALKSAHDAMPHTAHAKKTWLIAKAVIERDTHYGWEILNSPNQLRIQTIDSLCSFLTQQLPLLSQFGSQPDITNYPHRLYAEAVTEVLQHVEEDYAWSNELAQLLLHLDNDMQKLHHLLVHLLEKRDQWLPYLSLQHKDSKIRVQLENYLRLVIQEHLINLTQCFPNECTQELLDLVRFAAGNIPRESPLYACLDLTALPGTQTTDLPKWLAIGNFLLTKTYQYRKRLDVSIGFPALSKLSSKEKSTHTIYRERYQALIDMLCQKDDLRTAFKDLNYAPVAVYQEDSWQILQALLHVLKICASQLRVTFQQYGKIDYIENAQAALLALGSDDNPTNLALSLDYQIKHILIDEFQDTSFSQYQLLEKLTAGWQPEDGRTLFVVGDPMQSIYRFREAEVGIYIRMFESGMPNIPLQPLKLFVNFRSQANIVNWNNHHFDKIFPTYNDIAAGAVRYCPSIANATESSTDSFIELKGYAENDHAQSESIIKIIQDCLNHFPNETIAILVRSRSHLYDIVPYLRKAKLNYHAVDIDLLSTKPFIQDLLALTSALLHPADRIAWLSILRAPWCGLSLSDLHAIASSSTTEPIFALLTKDSIFKKISTAGQIRLAKILPILKNAITHRERTPLREWIEEVWLLLGGPATLSDKSDLNDSETYFKLLTELSEQSTIVDISLLRESVNNLYASTQNENAKIQIMTVHAAKGLEFDTVIIPHLDRKMPSDDKSLLAWLEQPLHDEKNALIISPIHAMGKEVDKTYEYISYRQKIKANYETDRLLYVATTRAKHRLALFFNADLKEDNELRVETGSFLHKLWPIVAKQPRIIVSHHTQPISTLEKERYLKRFAENWVNPIKMITETVSYHRKENGFALRDTTPQLFGVILHRLMQQLSLQGITWWSSQTNDKQHTYLMNQLRQSGFSGQRQCELVTKMQKIITNVLADERGKWILRNHPEAHAEYEMTALVEDKYERLVIDRTFLSDGTRWIIDYKTTALLNTDLEKFLSEQYEYYLAKMMKYQQAFSHIESHPIKLGLYFPAIPAWKEWTV